MSKKFYLPEMTRDEVKEAVRDAVLLMPMATIEQHGPHLPLHTDIDNVTGLVMGVAKKLDPDPRVLVAVPIWFSPSPFDLKKYPGGIMMRDEIYMEALNDILESYIRSGFKKIVVINGHGGGTERLIPRVIDRFNSRFNPKRESHIWPDWQIPEDVHVVGFSWPSFLGEFAAEELAKIRKRQMYLGADWHAGDVETSLQLYLRPDLVDMTKAKKGYTYHTDRKFAAFDLLVNWHWMFIIDGYYCPKKGNKGEIEDVYGDPTLASREMGEKVFKLAVDKISEFIKEFAE